MTFILGMIAGGVLIYLFPGLGTGGSAAYKSLKQFWDRIGQ